MRQGAMLGQTIMAAAVLLASSACAHGIGAAGATPSGDGGRPVQLQVSNRSEGPIEVFATGSGTSYRIGTVHPGIDGNFVVRRGMVENGAVEFVARSMTGHLIESGPLLLAPGDVVDFALTRFSATSTATVRLWVSGS